LALKKQHFAEGEKPIFDKACIYKRSDYWQFRMWLPKENAEKNEGVIALKDVKRLCKNLASLLACLRFS